jgi:hypothetical protein
MGVIDLTSPTSATALLSVNTSTVSDQIVERARMNRDRNQEERRQRIENLVERISSYTPEQEENEQHYRLRSSVSHRTRSAPGASLTRHDDLVERILSRSSSRIRPSPRTLSASTDTMMDTSSSGGEASQSLPPPSSGNHAETDAAFARRLQLEYLQAYQEEEHQRQRARQQALERRQFDHTTTTSSINPDEMSYDELLRLGEQMGDVKKEKWRQIAVQVLSSLPTHRWKKTHHSNTIEDKELDHTCVICQYNFIPNDQIITLPCAHIFHELCVEGWIRENNSCPLCKNEIMAVY